MGVLLGIVPDHLPAVTGRVERVRVMHTRYRRGGVEGRSWWEPVPGSTTLAGVRESPRWFARSTTGPGRPHEDGVLVDVHIPVEAPEPSS